jgi:hypothetical protein
VNDEIRTHLETACCTAVFIVFVHINSDNRRRSVALVSLSAEPYRCMPA